MPIKYYTGFESDVAILTGDGLALSGATVSTVQRHRTLSGRGGDRSILVSGTCRIPAFTVGVEEEIGVAFYRAAGTTLQIVFANPSQVENCSIRIVADNFMRLHRSGTVLATSVGVVPADTWNWVKIIITAREAVDGGRIIAYLNGSTTPFVDTGAGVDCANTVTPDFDSVALIGASGSVYFDDYIQASSGTLPDRELFVQMIRPTGDSTPTDATPSTGTDNFATVDEDPVSLIDYNEITVSGDEDRFTFANLGFTPLDIMAVRTMSHMTAEGSITDGRGVVRSGGVDDYGTNRAIATGGTYGIVGDIFELDPSGNPWTGATVDGIIAGYQAN